MANFRFVNILQLKCWLSVSLNSVALICCDMTSGMYSILAGLVCNSYRATSVVLV